MAATSTNSAPLLQRALSRLGVSSTATAHVWSLPMHARAAALRPPCSRWTPARKAVIVTAIRHGELDQADAQTQLDLTLEELTSWAGRLDAYGVAGLRSTKLQLFRSAET